MTFTMTSLQNAECEQAIDDQGFDEATHLDLSNVSVQVDYSGTIVNDIIAALNGFNHVLVLRDKDPVSLNRFRRDFELPYWTYLVKRGLTEKVARSDRVLREIEEIYVVDMNNVALFPETVATMKCLRSLRARVAVVSSSTRAMVDNRMDRFDLHGHFDAVIAYEDCPKSKPDPDPLLLGRKKLGEAEWGFYIGDMRVDIIAAIRAGLIPISLSRNGSYNSRTSLQGVGTAYIARNLWDAIRFVEKYVQHNRIGTHYQRSPTSTVKPSVTHRSTWKRIW